jgi:hypothetical protein
VTGDSFPGMRTFAAWFVGVALTGSSIACIPATEGLGEGNGEEPAEGLETEDSGAELGGEATESNGEAEENPETGDGDGDGDAEGDGEPLPMCTVAEDPLELGIELFGTSLEPDDCSEPIINARVNAVSEGGSHLMTWCDCNARECVGQALELDISVPDPAWLPGLEVGTCYTFYVYAEELEPGICRRNRVDIGFPGDPVPWYSIGTAREDLDVNGLAISPVLDTECTDSCGEWQVRDVTFASNGSEQTLGWGDSAAIGNYAQIINWHSYVNPDGCGSPAVDVTAWTARP